MRARTFLRDGGGPAQLRIDARINLRDRINDLPRLIFGDDLGRLFASGSILEKEGLEKGGRLRILF